MCRQTLLVEFCWPNLRFNTLLRASRHFFALRYVAKGRSQQRFLSICLSIFYLSICLASCFLCLAFDFLCLSFDFICLSFYFICLYFYLFSMSFFLQLLLWNLVLSFLSVYLVVCVSIGLFICLYLHVSNLFSLCLIFFLSMMPDPFFPNRTCVRSFVRSTL